MSTLETNSIGKYSGNNVSVDDALNLKSYTTTQRDALTSVAGDMIYNTTDSGPQFYNGTTWNDMVAPGTFSFNRIFSNRCRWWRWWWRTTDGGGVVVEELVDIELLMVLEIYGGGLSGRKRFKYKNLQYQ